MEKTIGQILRETRGKRKVSLEAVHKQTKISLKYLSALEEDRSQDFPAEVYFLGFLRQYAKFLGLDAEELVQIYHHSKQTVEAESTKTKIKPKVPIISKKNRIVLLLIFFVIVFIYLFPSLVRFEKKSPPSPPPASLPKEEKMILEAKAVADTWMRVIADDNLLYERILSTGTEKRWEAKEKFHIRVGYVRGVEVKLNGISLDLTTGSTGYVKEFDLFKAKK